MAPTGSSAVLTAKDIMATKLITLTAEMSVHDAIELLLKNHVSGAPVVDKDYNLVGVLSEKDCISEFVGAVYQQLPTGRVEHAMSTEIQSVTEDTDLLTIAHFFKENHYRRLPVVREKKLVGQISRRDLLNAIKQILTQTPDHRAVLLYLSAVSSPEDVSFH